MKTLFGENDVIDDNVSHAKNHHLQMMKHNEEDLEKTTKDAQVGVSLGLQIWRPWEYV